VVYWDFQISTALQRESAMSHSSVVRTKLEIMPPPSPESIAEVGVRQAFLEELALKVLYVAGPLSLRELASQTRLTFGVMKELLHRLRAEHLCEVTGITGNIPEIAITSPGRIRALELLSANQYSGPAPVSLTSYVQQIRQQSVRNVEIHPPDVARAFAHMVLDPKTLAKLGTALNSGTSIFLYGPTGTGKSTIAMALSQAFAFDRVWIPYAVEVDGQVISVFDPHVHRQVNSMASHNSDARWVLCYRPSVLVGGELTMEMLELQLNPITKFYTAPAQMKANNGVLIIDDFGRQRLRPEELLNRWVVPLDRGIDFLSLAGGKKVEIPFELFVVFATNLDPATLVDAAFLRRIQTKIKVDAVAPPQFHEIFRGVCSEARLRYEPAVVDALIERIQNELKEPLRACYPRDIVNQIRWTARYQQREPVLDEEAVQTAVEAYFAAGTAATDME
jgi:predicted ATPase with chaperone activity